MFFNLLLLEPNGIITAHVVGLDLARAEGILEEKNQEGLKRGGRGGGNLAQF